jgi:cytochrome bd-type quinol oxidase subunit 2
MQHPDSKAEQAGMRTPFVQSYTVIFFALGAVALVNVFTLQLSLDLYPGDAEAASSQFRAVIRYVQATALIWAVAYCVVGILRVRGLVLARTATALLSVVSLFLFPFGTAAFIYWLGWVRKREMVSPAV